MGKGYENLIPFDERTEDEQRKLRSMGGVASGKSRRYDGMVRDVAQKILASLAPLSKEERKAIAERWNIDEDDVDVLFVSMQSISDKAMKGDLKAFEVIRDSAGEKPKDNLNMTHSFAPDEDVLIGYGEQD